MFLLSEFQTCPIDGMCALCLCHGGFMADFVLSSKVSFFTTKTTDYFIGKFKFISVQVVGDVIYFVISYVNWITFHIILSL